jgi:hypothetical protein
MNKRIYIYYQQYSLQFSIRVQKTPGIVTSDPSQLQTVTFELSKLRIEISAYKYFEKC